MTKHTPPMRLPLKLAEATSTIPIKDLNGRTVCSVKYGPNDLDYANFIKQACNSHAALVEALEDLITVMDEEVRPFAPPSEFKRRAESHLQIAKKALAKAKGE